MQRAIVIQRQEGREGDTSLIVAVVVLRVFVLSACQSVMIALAASSRPTLSRPRPRLPAFYKNFSDCLVLIGLFLSRLAGGKAYKH